MKVRLTSVAIFDNYVVHEFPVYLSVVERLAEDSHHSGMIFKGVKEKFPKITPGENVAMLCRACHRRLT